MAIYLSESATVIWRLCDGQRTIEDMRAILAKEYPEAASEIEVDISQAIDQMTSARVIVLVQRNDPVGEAIPLA